MSKRSERFNRSMRSLDEFVASFGDASKIAALSDLGSSVQRMTGDVNANVGEAASRRLKEDRARSLQSGETPLPQGEHVRDARLHAAEMRLYRAGRGYLVPVLRLIVRNGSERHLSLEKISRAQYFRHRDALLRFFS